MNLDARISRIGDALRFFVGELGARGFQFERPSETLPGPETGTKSVIERIERDVGAVPLAIQLFWERVGSVDLRGHHPEWHGCPFPDPVVVYPPSVALLELDDFLSDKEERLRCNFPYRIPFAPDPLHKAGVSGGMWYSVTVPAVADDPPLNDERHATTFVTHLELALEWAGFPGLAECPRHSWPVEDLRRRLEARA